MEPDTWTASVFENVMKMLIIRTDANRMISLFFLSLSFIDAKRILKQAQQL